jgi:hypothetical protein
MAFPTVASFNLTSSFLCKTRTLAEMRLDARRMADIENADNYITDSELNHRRLSRRAVEVFRFGTAISTPFYTR